MQNISSNIFFIVVAILHFKTKITDKGYAGEYELTEFSWLTSKAPAKKV